MGLWAVAKKYLNSTIGTSGGKALDIMIDEIKNIVSILQKDTEIVRTATGTTATLGYIDKTGSSSSYYYTVLFKGIAPITGLYTITGRSRSEMGVIYKVKKEKSSRYYNTYNAGSTFKNESIGNDADIVFRQTIESSNETFYMYAQAGEPIILLIDYGNVGLQDGSIKYKK